MNRAHRMAFAFGVVISLLQTGRMLLWGHWPRHWTGWFYLIDAYLVGGLLIAGGVISRRKEVAGRVAISAGWGFSCGILYRAFFEQLREPTRYWGHETLVLACKAALLAISVVGLAIALSHANAEKG